MPDRSPALLAQHLHEHWPHLREFFASRNWPDTKLGNAASCINDDVPHIVRALQGDWIPVTEKLPDDDLTVMIACKDADEPVWLGFHDESGWYSVDATPMRNCVTHWKPMPEGPNG